MLAGNGSGESLTTPAQLVVALLLRRLKRSASAGSTLRGTTGITLFMEKTTQPVDAQTPPPHCWHLHAKAWGEGG